MEFRILGPLEVRSERGVVALGGTKPRAVLAVLLMHPNKPVSAERLALALWGEDAPSDAVKTVRVHVSRLRKALGDGEVVTTTAAGYQLRVRPGELDAERFEELVERGRRALAAGQAQEAAAVLRNAEGLWRGPPLADLAFEPFAQTEIARLEEEQLAALEARVEADAAAGRHAELVPELRRLVAEHPTREGLAGQLMLALYRCGRQSEALNAYQEARRRLADEIGVEPGPELRALQEAILRHDPTLKSPQLAQELPDELAAAATSPLIGRGAELRWLLDRWEQAVTGAGALITIAGPYGIGKTRLAAELAEEVHERGAGVLFASGAGPGPAILRTLERAREATRATLLVLDDVDRAGGDASLAINALSRSIAPLPVLTIAMGEDDEALADLRPIGELMPEPLGREAVRAIAERYAPDRDPAEVPAGWLLDASDGIPRRVHEVAGQWARREAARRVGAVADRAAAGRAELRSMEDELAGGVVQLHTAREQLEPAAGHGEPIVCPFKGLASFEAADASYFFGRERLVAELVARLVGAPLLGVVGASGSGKSSVVRAGLLPALAGGVLPGSEEWPQALIRPGEHPLHELHRATAGLDATRRAVIAVDQFEETFTTCRDEDERARFISELVRASRGHDGSIVVVATRADFYGRCAAYPELSRLLAANHVLVGSMQPDELRRAIELPARRVGLRVDTELADALVADVKGEPGALPLLSTALLELWQRREGRRLRHTVYVQSGGVRGAVARLAENAFRELDGEQQLIARGVLMRLAGEGAAGGVERRRVALAELETDRNEDVAHVVALLTDRRLLTVSSGTVELAHEALMREWPRLRDWIDADREGLRIHRNISAAALEWEKFGRDDGALYRGVRLTEAIEWNETQQPRLNEVERAFLATAEAARQRDRVTRRRRIAFAFGSLTVALLAISIVAIISVVQGRKVASRELASRSQAVLASDPALALAIGLDALRRHDTPEAQNAIRQATLVDRATAVIHAHSSPIYRAALSPDGSRVATAADDGLVRISRLQDARVVSTIRGQTDPALDVSFSPSGKQVAIASLDGEVAIADLDGGRRRVVASLGGRTGRYARSVEYSADGGDLLVAVTDGTVRLIRLADSHSSIVARHEGVRVAHFDWSGRRVLTAGQDGNARVWTITGSQTASMPHGNGIDLFDAAVSPNGRRVGTAGSDGAVRIWSVATGRLLRKLAVDLQPLYSLQFSSAGGRVVTGGSDGVVRISDIRGGPVITELEGHRDRVYDAGFMSDDSVYSVGTDGTVRTWAPPQTATLPADEAGIPFAPSFSPDRNLVVSGYDDGHVNLWNPETDGLRTLPGYMGESAAVYSPDGAYILSWTSSFREGAMRVYDVGRRTSTFVRVPPDPGVYTAAIDSTGRRIARAGLGERVVIQAADGTSHVTLPDHGQANWLAFSPDGKHLVSASDDGTARIWNAASGAAERSLTGIEGAVLWATYSPDGKRVAAAGADGTIRIWTLAGGDPMVLYGHDGPVNTLGFNAQGNRLVSGGKDGTVRIWDAIEGEALVVLHSHEGEVSGVGFSPDGQDVVSGADDGLRVSSCEVCGTFSQVLALAEAKPGVKLTAAERARFVIGGG